MEKGDSTPGRRKGYSKWKDACCMSTECLKRALLICQGSMRTLVKVANSRRCVLGTAKDLRHGIFGFKNGPQRDFPGGKVVNNLPSNAGDSGSIPGSLVVRWLTICLPMQGTQVRSLVPWW